MDNNSANNNNNNNNNVESDKVPFETALNKTGFGLYSWSLIALNGLSIIAFACIVYSSMIVVQSSKFELNTSIAQQGLLVAAPIVAAVLGSILWGYLADIYGRRLVLLASFCLATIFNSIACISVNWIMLLVLQSIASFMAAGLYSVTMTLLSECVPLARRNLVVLIVASIFLLSQGIMSLMVIPVEKLKFSILVPVLNIQWNSWRLILLIYGIPSIICFIWMLFMEESPKFVFLKKGEEEALKVLKRIHRLNHFNSKEELEVKGLVLDNEVKSEEQNNKSVKELFKGKMLKYLIIMTTLAAFQQIGAFLIWLPTIADQFVKTLKDGGNVSHNLCQLKSAGNATTANFDETALEIVFGVACLLSIFNLLLVLVVGKFGRRNMVIVIASVCGVSGIIVNLIPNAIGSVIFFIIFLMGFLLIGLYTAISVALFPTHLRASAISLTMAGGRIMLFATVQILNKLLTTNCELGFYIFASLIAASAIVAFFLPDERFINKPKEIGQIEEAEMTSYVREKEKYSSSEEKFGNGSVPEENSISVLRWKFYLSNMLKNLRNRVSNLRR